jgi:thiol-disulfide isomerase/thioredoxin
MNTKRILAAAAVAAVAAAGGFAAAHWPRHGGDAASVAQAAPTPGDPVAALWDAPMKNADGQPQSLAMFKGRPVVINFWASWCGPCVEEMPTLARLHREYANKGVQFIGIGVDSEKNVKAFLQKVPVDYPIYVSGFGGADLARSFGNTSGALPFTVVIDAKGTIRSTKLGQIQPDELRRTLGAL